MEASEHPGRRAGQGGFNLVEIIVTVAIVAALAALATPGIKAFVARRAVNAAVSDLASDYRFARSEALKRSSHVAICRSPNGRSCGDAGAPGSWHDGWIVFTDPNQNRQVDDGEEILRVQPRLDNVKRIGQDSDPDFTGTRQNTLYGPNGLSFNEGETLVIMADESVVGGTRKFVISGNGRVAVSPVGAPLP